MNERVRNRIRELREKKGWTQQDVAAEVGVSRQSIISIEHDRYVPSLALALKLARLFGRPPGDLFWLEEKRR